MEYVCARSCLTLCYPIDCSPPDSYVHGLFQAKILEWVAISFSRGSSQPRDWTHVSCVSCIGRKILSLVQTGKPLTNGEGIQNFIMHLCALYSFNTIVLLWHRLWEIFLKIKSFKIWNILCFKSSLVLLLIT